MIDIILSGLEKESIRNIHLTPLHIAVEEGNENTIKFLIDYGFFYKKKDELGRTPISIAKQKKRPDLVDLIKEEVHERTNKKLFDIQRELEDERKNRALLEAKFRELETKVLFLESLK